MSLEGRRGDGIRGGVEAVAPGGGSETCLDTAE